MAELLNGRLPLAGRRVVALEQSIAAPVASRVLADLGADVIKVEPAGGDFARHWDGYAAGMSSHFAWANRRKRSIVLNLREEQDAETLTRLLASADVLVCNMQASAAERAVLTQERLEAEFPSLVVCQVTGYGMATSGRHRKAYDMLLQAETGLMSLTGSPSEVVRIGVSISDIGTGLEAAVLILAALLERDLTGRGRYIDLSMFEAMTEFTGPSLTAFANSGVMYKRNPLRHHSIVPYGVFECADGPVALAVEQQSEWAALCEAVLSRPDLAHDPRFASNELRVAARSSLEPELEAVFKVMTVNQAVMRLSTAGIGYGVINDIDAVWYHPVSRELNLHARGIFRDGTELLLPRSPIERAFGVLSPAFIPEVDQHRGEILAELGMGQDSVTHDASPRA